MSYESRSTLLSARYEEVAKLTAAVKASASGEGGDSAAVQAAIAAAAGCSLEDAAAELSACAADIAEIKAGTRQLLTGQDEIKAMLVQIAGGGGGGGASSARAKAQEVYRAMQAAAGSGATGSC